MLLITLAVVGCRDAQRSETQRTASTGPVGEVAVPVAMPGDSLRVMRPGERGHVPAEPIQWDADAVGEHLSGMGLDPVAAGAIKRPFFRVTGQRFHLLGGRAMVEAFFYGDANAVALDSDKLDTVLVALRGGRMQWQMAPRLLTDNNMAAVILTDDAAIRRKIETALHSQLHGRTWVP